MTEKEALKLALEAFEWNYNTDLDNIPACEQWAKMLKENITAIREALAQPEDPCKGANYSQTSEQEPVAWMYQDKSTHEVLFQKHMRGFVDHSRTSEVPLYSEPLANHELQCVCGAVWCGDEMVHLPNKTPPQPEPVIDKSAAVRIATSLGWVPKRAWVGLSDEQWQVMADTLGCLITRTQKDAIEAVIGIKE